MKNFILALLTSIRLLNITFLTAAALALLSGCASDPKKPVSAKESAANLRWFRKRYLDADLTDKLNTTQIVYNPLKSNHYATKPLWE